jgi:endonuclease G
MGTDDCIEDDVDLANRRGFDESFLRFHTPMPRFGGDILDDELLVAGSTLLRYEHFSLAMSKGRRMARWVAWNIDPGTLITDGTVGRDELEFRCDPRLNLAQQIVNDAYHRNILDRGHIARRADLLWGSLDQAIRANSDSFYFPNITPQAAKFNQSSKSGPWGLLENALLAEVRRGQDRVSVFGGPIFRPSDRSYRTIQVPEAFWKLFAYQLDGQPRAKAFVLTQVLDQLERRIELPDWATFERPIVDLERETSLDLGTVRTWDRHLLRTETVATDAIRDVREIVW